MLMHTRMHVQHRAPLLLEKGSWIRIFLLISALSLRLSTLFHSISFKSSELLGEKKKEEEKKIKHQIFKLTWRREAFCAHVPTLGHQTKRKISFLTCGNTLSTRNRPVHLVKQSLYISPTQQVTSSTKDFKKKSQRWLLVGVLQSVSIDNVSKTCHSGCYHGCFMTHKPTLV